MKITKNDLIKELTEKLEIAESLSKKAINLVLETIQNALVRGDEVSLSGVGSLKIKTIAAREGTCNGKAYKSPASKSVKLTASTTIKELLNK